MGKCMACRARLSETTSSDAALPGTAKTANGAPDKRLRGELVYIDECGFRGRVKAAMSLFSGRVFIFPFGRPGECAVPACSWGGNPSGNGELQVWGFQCLPVREGRLLGGTPQVLQSIVDELRRLDLLARLVYH